MIRQAQRILLKCPKLHQLQITISWFKLGSAEFQSQSYSASQMLVPFHGENLRAHLIGRRGGGGLHVYENR